MTTIAQMSGKWYVVKSKIIDSGTHGHVVTWIPVSVGYTTVEQARAQQANLVFGRV